MKWLRIPRLPPKHTQHFILLAGGQAATLPESKPDNRLADRCEPSTTGISESEIEEHQAVDGKQAAEQEAEEKKQAQEPVEVPVQEEHTKAGPMDVSDAAADPEDTLAADESQLPPSMIPQL